MDAMAAHLEAGGVKVTRGSRALAAQRAVSDLITLSDPAGNSLEVFHGPARASTPFQPARSMRGFRTGALGMGHCALIIPSALFESTSRFYRDLLGFRVSDFATVEGKRWVEFMHINPREHSLVIVSGSMMPGDNDKPQLGHIMMEMQYLDDVGQTYDVVARDYNNDLFLTLGRHNNDLMTSFYVHTPSGFLIECGWGGLSIDPDKWQADELPLVSIWGHQMMQDGKPVKSPFPAPAVRALAAPLQVSGENFESNYHPTRLNQVLKMEPVR
jgi:2,3-dihydroxybiphenyl 1,2-dioxygenase